MATKKRGKKSSSRRSKAKKSAHKKKPSAAKEQMFDWVFWLIMAVIVFGLVMAVMGSLA